MPKVEEQKEREMLQGEGGDYPWEETASSQGQSVHSPKRWCASPEHCVASSHSCALIQACECTAQYPGSGEKHTVKLRWRRNESVLINPIVQMESSSTWDSEKRKWHSQRTALYHPRVIRLWQSNCLVWMGTGAQNHQLHVRMCMNTEGKTDTCMNTPTSVHINTYTYIHAHTYTFLPPKSCDIINSHLIPTARIYQKLCWHYMCVHDR